jgi:hypothetical protein
LIENEPKIYENMCKKQPAKLAQLNFDFMLNHPVKAARSEHDLMFKRLRDPEGKYDDAFEIEFLKVASLVGKLIDESENDPVLKGKYELYEQERKKFQL